MMRTLIFISACLLLLACKKQERIIQLVPASDNDSQFRRFTIPAGQKFSTYNPLIRRQTSELNFTVKFDSSAIYTTVDPANQEFANTLYGLSTDIAPYETFSFGWRWKNNELHLFGIVSNNGIRVQRDLQRIDIGKEYNCSITIDGSAYVFKIDANSTRLTRTSTSPQAIGRLVFPSYADWELGGPLGGVEIEQAPHEINIWKKER